MKKVDDLEFTDDYMFGAVLRNKEICKGILERLLKIKVADIEYPELQKSLKIGYEAHGIRLDVYVQDSSKIYDVEMQNKIFDDLGKRTRFYQSMIDADFLLAGNDYSDLKECVIIFICKQDPYNSGKPQYTFKNICIEDNTVLLDDKATKVIYNASSCFREKDMDLRAFLNYVSTNKATDEFTTRLQNCVANIKRNEIFRTEYNKMNIAIADARREGRLEAHLEAAIIAVKDFNINPELVAEKYNIPLAKLEKALKENEA